MVVGEGRMTTYENPETGKGWTDAEEATMAQIMAEDGCARLEAMRTMRRRAASSEPTRIAKMNVSKEADTEFMRALEREDPERCARLQKNMRRDDPNAGMREDQALTNFMLGLPTGSLRFAVVAGSGAPVSAERKNVDRLLREGTDAEWTRAIVALANAPEAIYVTQSPQPITPTAIQSAKRTGGRPKLTRAQRLKSRTVRREKVRANVARHREVLCNQKTPSQPIDYADDTSAIFASA
jgi:hypothetical protein